MPTHRELPRPGPSDTCYVAALPDAAITICHEPSAPAGEVCVRCGRRLQACR
jgi:hypothetical protein